jgi:hypothetical protein
LCHSLPGKDVSCHHWHHCMFRSSACPTGPTASRWFQARMHLPQHLQARLTSKMGSDALLRTLITENNKIRLVLLGMHSRTFGPYVATIDRIRISVMACIRLSALAPHPQQRAPIHGPSSEEGSQRPTMLSKKKNSSRLLQWPHPESHEASNPRHRSTKIPQARVFTKTQTKDTPLAAAHHGS